MREGAPARAHPGFSLTAGPSAAEDGSRSRYRRRVVVLATLPMGTVLLAFAFAQPPGSVTFYLFATAVAVTWAVGGVLSGPLPRGWPGAPLGRVRVPGGWTAAILLPVAVGLLAAGAVLASVSLAREVAVLGGFLDDLLTRSRGPAAPTAFVALANGAAEEVFFRGALYAAIGPGHRVALSTVVYALATVATGNPALVGAAVALGVVFGLQRRVSGWDPRPGPDPPDVVGRPARHAASAGPLRLRSRRPTPSR